MEEISIPMQSVYEWTSDYNQSTMVSSQHDEMDRRVIDSVLMPAGTK